MERGVEHGDLRFARHQLFDGFDAHQVGGVVKRREFAAAFNLVHHVGRDPDTAVKEFAAVRHAVADGIDAVE